jgi:ADP-heptose:LPS heptosyltransferase
MSELAPLRPAERRRVLVIKHGALGDFVQSLGPFQAIRAHHLGDSVTLLTGARFAEVAANCGYFDEVWIDDRPPPWRLGALWELRRRLREGRFARVYDLQTSTRSSLYFRLLPFRQRPEWSGIARGCSHPHANPDRDRMHTVDRQAEQLEAAGIRFVPPPDLAWARGNLRQLGVEGRFALLVPGGSRHRPGKRWPAQSFVSLARLLAADGTRPVLIGGAEEATLLRSIAGACPAVLDLGGRTGFADLAELARHARFAVGNDTGPMQLFAAAGCPVLVLFSDQSDPALCAPRGPRVRVLRQAALADLPLARVAGELSALARLDKPA